MRGWYFSIVLVLMAPDAGASVTTVIPPDASQGLKGCWQTADGIERWVFRAKGPDGLDVVREVKAPFRVDYVRRARIPRDVLYDPSTHEYAFGAAGRIHALMFLFTREHDRKRVWLSVSTYTSHVRGAWYRTGDSFEVRRCAVP